ncbi:Glycerol-3-phosphate acyltransferase 9 [Nosema granulosis]|uniref:Glycerol-3-phosphate acyltransferase 9 n=1 Tax=Nosema granulosis TaxID=83296 RepID=A0A9P6GWX7_9MICR|nr:Glycerol-3-phosphate acyltransferase 9 [Nosema granulosis]
MTIEKKKTFLHDAVDMVALSTHSLESDDFSRCFQPIPRTEMDSSGIFYIFSFTVRYFILFPIRLFLLLLVLLVYAILISRALLYNSENKMHFAYVFVIKALTFILGARLTHHGSKKKLETPHIFVSNHTSFVDFILLSSYQFPHACVSENHGGLFSILFQLILARNGSVAFKRCEKMDRALVKKKMYEHVSKNQLPMLVFPEGTCVNNKYSVMFQKGVFELDVDVCPVAIRYRRRLLDPYWNRRSHGFTLHLFYLMTRWFIEADVFWMPPVRRRSDETPSEFAFRTKMLISEKAGLKNSLWNGYLKSSPAIKDRELLKVAFKRAYNSLYEKTEEPSQYEIEDKNIDHSSYYSYTVFGSISYKEFVNEMLKDYHKLKSMTIKDQQILMSKSATSLSLENVSKKGCACKKLALRRHRKMYKFKNCRMDAIVK